MILAIDARRARQEGLVIMQAGKTVYLVDQVPPSFLSRRPETGDEGSSLPPVT